MNGVTILDICSCCMIALAVSGSVGGAEVYRCDGSGGGPIFQDVPCATHQKQTRLHLVEDPPVQPGASEPATDDVAPADTAPRSPAPSAPSGPPAPSFFLCTAGDGSRYVSETGAGRVNWVPYTMVAGQSLAEAYGGRNGLASHPSNEIPHRPASAAPGAGTYVEVVDPCHHAAPAEACAYLHGQLDDLDGKLRRAFSNTEAQLKRERAGVAEQLRGCR